MITNFQEKKPSFITHSIDGKHEQEARKTLFSSQLAERRLITPLNSDDSRREILGPPGQRRNFNLLD